MYVNVARMHNKEEMDVMQFVIFSSLPPSLPPEDRWN